MARQRDLQRERTWRQHLERQRTSRFTIRDYCVRHNLAEAAFYRWRRIVSDRDRAAASPAVPPPTFVPVTVLASPAGPSPIDIHLAAGQRVRVRAGCDRDLLAAVLALLEGRSC